MSLLKPNAFTITENGFSTLHSTMSLLKLKCVHHLVICLHTLHSTMSLLKPICAIAKRISPSCFTFNYVSIKTEERNRDRAVSIFFTFHYVSIKTRIHFVSCLQLTYFTFHYVSIKTLYTPCMVSAPRNFTFHYVSIKTRSCRIKEIHLILLYIPLCLY